MTHLQQHLHRRTWLLSLAIAGALSLTPSFIHAQSLTCASGTVNDPDYPFNGSVTDVEQIVCVSSDFSYAEIENDSYDGDPSTLGVYGVSEEVYVLDPANWWSTIYDSGMQYDTTSDTGGSSVEIDLGNGVSPGNILTTSYNECMNGAYAYDSDPNQCYWDFPTTGLSVQEPNAPTLSVTTSGTPAANGQLVTFAATLSVNASGETMYFDDGAGQIGSATISGTSATYTTNTLTKGFHYISAYYPGDSTNSAVTSNVISQAVGILYGYALGPNGTPGYDGVGNVLNYIDTVNGTWNMPDPGGYDDLNRLSAATQTINGTVQPYCWAYDAFGNRISNACSISPTVTYNSQNHVTWVQDSAPIGFTYDSAGNVTSDALNQYLYDADGRVCAVEMSVAGVVTITGYIYDAEGNRVAKGNLTLLSCDMSLNAQGAPNNGFQQSTWDIRGPSGEQLTETDGQGNWNHTNVYADDEVIGTYVPAGLYFQLSDWQGTRRVETDYAGNVQESCTSLPFGDGNPNCNVPTEQFFTGQERDPQAESGNDYFPARYYASNMGRWITPDPYNGSYNLEDPQSLNRYAYVEGSPQTNTDPSGLSMLSDMCGDIPSFVIQPLFLLQPPFKGGGAGNDEGSVFKDINLATTYAGYVGQVRKHACVKNLEALAELAGKKELGAALHVLLSSGSKSKYASPGAYLAYIQGGMQVGCSIDYNSTVCGSPELAWLIPGGGGNVGKAVGDALDVGFAVCTAGGITNAACDVFALYELANKIYGFLYSLFGWAPPTFKGSMEPRPGVPNMQGDSWFGVPINGENLDRQTGKSSRAVVPSPTFPITQD